MITKISLAIIAIFALRFLVMVLIRSAVKRAINIEEKVFEDKLKEFKEEIDRVKNRFGLTQPHTTESGRKIFVTYSESKDL